MCIQETLDLQGFGSAIDHDTIVAGAAIQPFAFAGIHSPRNIGYGEAEFYFVVRQHWSRDESAQHHDRDGTCAHEKPPQQAGRVMLRTRGPARANMKGGSSKVRRLATHN